MIQLPKEFSIYHVLKKLSPVLSYKNFVNYNNTIDSVSDLHLLNTTATQISHVNLLNIYLCAPSCNLQQYKNLKAELSLAALY